MLVISNSYSMYNSKVQKKILPIYWNLYNNFKILTFPDGDYLTIPSWNFVALVNILGFLV